LRKGGNIEKAVAMKSEVGSTEKGGRKKIQSPAKERTQEKTI